MRYSTLGRALLIALGMGHGVAAIADIYVWRDPESGQKKFSNIPPAWYREEQRVTGPRVVVMRGSEVVDDTAWPLAQRRRPIAQLPSIAPTPEAKARRGDTEAAFSQPGLSEPYRKALIQYEMMSATKLRAASEEEASQCFAKYRNHVLDPQGAYIVEAGFYAKGDDRFVAVDVSLKNRAGGAERAYFVCTARN